ncbi:chymotrypsin-like [Anopheles aquasalis]|uniref:chymotrypsin-like n=1 Tax=Anopheles aquasalis TaxID=42839 RepID=UPI00215B4203|nr:chymotrypsin-like [Anopheles aquasalis]
MKGFVVLVALFAVVSAKWIDIDWSKVRPIEEFDHYWARLPAEMQIYRHASPSPRIVGGQEATPGQFPYQVALVGEYALGTGVCGGSILTNLYVLTAAHYGGSPSDVLMYTSNPVITNADCIPYYNSALIEPQNVCLSSAGGRNVCNSDSGGPLTVQDGGSVQIGVVSFGRASCADIVPSVHARVTYYLEWIEANSDFVANP